ncbi:MAG: hypothetical protein ABI411_10980 [Tahibacter sp.]
MSSLLPAELAWYVTGRFYRREDGALADYGYFIHIAGIDDTLFCGAAGETTAYFTFAATPFKAGGIVNGALTLATDPVGEFSVYLQRTPAGDFNRPESFAQGERLATFRRTSMVVGTTVESGSGSTGAPLFGNNVFSAKLLQSTEFEFANRHYNLAQLLGPGVTQFGTAAAAPVLPPANGYVAVVPFSGSAIALARPQGESLLGLLDALT